jgi:glucokinase
MKKACTVGIDLGGTKIFFALVSEEGEILYEFKDTTGAAGGENLLDRLIQGCKNLAGEAEKLNLEVKAVGIGSPGRIDSRNGIVVDCTPNIKDWQGTKIKEAFEAVLNLPTFTDNDANVAAYGEYCLRKFKGKIESPLLVLTLGTGLGSGIIYEERLFRGNGLGAEIGHMILEKDGRQCNCGQKGCFEMYVSGTALENQAKERLIKYPESILKRNGEKITSHDIFSAASSGDLFSLILIDEMADYLANGLISLVNIFDPEIILLAGGISRQKEMFLDKVLYLVANNINYKNFKASTIQIAETNEKAGLAGAGLIAFYGYHKGEI